MTTLNALNNSYRDYYWNKNPPTTGTNYRQLSKRIIANSRNE